MPVDVYRRDDGTLLVHPGGDAPLAAPDGCAHVGRALLAPGRWSRVLGAPVQQAQGAIVPREYAVELVTAIQVFG